MPPGEFPGDDGVVRVRVDEPFDFSDLVDGAYDQIRQCAAFHAIVYVQILDGLRRVATCVRDDSRHAPLLSQGQLVMAAAERCVPDQADRDEVRARYDELVRVAAPA
jgi:uncharacterized membrane protein